MGSRKTTDKAHHERVNEVLYHIHANLAAPLSALKLAEQAHYSPHHFHRVFKKITGENVNDYIRRSRLEWAANLLIFNAEASVGEVSRDCGFNSSATFTHEFRKRFACTPTEWRQGGYEQFSRVMKARSSATAPLPQARYYQNKSDAMPTLPPVVIKALPARRVAYIRHRGYDEGIADAWMRLSIWLDEQGVNIQEQVMLGLHHSNPDLIPYAYCRYVACCTVPEYIYRQGDVGVMNIPAGLYAVCRAQGEFGDLLYLMHTLYHDWLPCGRYEARNIPPYALYRDNHFLNDSGRFDLDYCIPVKLK